MVRVVSTSSGTLFAGCRSGCGGGFEVEGFVDHRACCCWFGRGIVVVLRVRIMWVVLGCCAEDLVLCCEAC